MSIRTFTIFAVFFILFFNQPLALAGSVEPDFKGWVQVTPKREVYVEWHKAKAGFETIVLLNGLTYEITAWDSVMPHLLDKGLGVIRFDPAGMGETLKRFGPIAEAIGIDEQARDIQRMTAKLGIKDKLNLVGLSYGGGLAVVFGELYPKRVKQLILAAPFTEPMPQQDAWIRGQITWTRAAFPFNPASDEELYAFFLRQAVYFIYPLTEPSLYSHEWKREAVYQMTQGIRKYDIKGAARKLPPRSLHMIVPGLDQYIPGPVYEDFWVTLPAGIRASRVRVKGAQHKIGESEPVFFAHWVNRIVTKDPVLFEGRSFELWPHEISQEAK